MARYYTQSALDATLETGRWDVEQLSEGTLLSGNLVLRREGYKTMVLIETFLNSQSSAYTVKKFDESSELSAKKLSNLIERLRG